MEEVLLLLENFWILREKRPEDYYRIKDRERVLRDFFRDKLGYTLVINRHLIRLVKIPGEARAWMGIQAFSEPLDYSFLFMLLSFLEDKGAEDQFVLSELTEYIVTLFPGVEEIDWTLFRQRRSLVRVLQYARELGLLQINDGSEQSFSENAEAEILYESTGLSRYFLPFFTSDITEFSDVDSFLHRERGALEEDRGLIRRHRVYRRLILSPAVYSRGSDDPDFQYLKNYKPTLERDLAQWLGAELHLHRYSASVVLNDRRFSQQTFPEGNNLCDIALKLALLLREGVSEQRWSFGEDGTIVMVEAEFKRLLAECQQRYAQNWYKTWREKPLDKLAGEIIAYLEDWEMASWDPELRTVMILPLALKLVGEYPKGE